VIVLYELLLSYKNLGKPLDCDKGGDITRIEMLRKLNHYLARVSIFLVAAALIAGTVGCGLPAQYNLTMAVAPGGSGTATDLTSASPYAAGTEVSIKAVANSGYWFVNWTAPAGTFGSAIAATTTFTMPAQNVTVTANFEPSEFHGGTGTAEDPYQIADWHQLDFVRNYLDSYFLLVGNIGRTTPGYEELASPTANGGKGWQPIGSSEYDGFIGTFDGQGYEIRDLYINRPSEDYVGLFGAVERAGVIQDIGVVSATVIGAENVGGLVGRNGLDSTVINSYSTGSVTGMYDVGGLVGENEYGAVSNSHATGSVTGYQDVGGLVGFNSVGDVHDSYSTGNVTGNWGVGGLVGVNWGMCDVYDSYSTGNVTGTSYVGGLVGYNLGGIVDNSFWDIETSGQATSAGGTGQNTTEMQDITTFSGATWDIVAVALNETNPAYTWNIVNNVTYPFLSWQP
jgi:hypothetical protein